MNGWWSVGYRTSTSCLRGALRRSPCRWSNGSVSAVTRAYRKLTRGNVSGDSLRIFAPMPHYAFTHFEPKPARPLF